LANEQMQGLSQLLSSLQLELNNAANSTKSSKESDSMRHRANDLTSSISNSRSAINFYDQEIARTNLEFDQTLERYRRVVKKTK